MKETREHPLWMEARRLTLLAYRLTSGFPKDDRVQRLSSEIEGTCVTLLTHLVQTRERPAREQPMKPSEGQDVMRLNLRKVTRLASKLTRLLLEARREGLLRHTDYEWLGRELRSFQRSLESLNSHV